jgi:non-lysosomal glucosylceramidase
VPVTHTQSALDTIYRLNVRGFGGGEMGAVNGMRPDGSPDTSNMQSEEVWTGTTYALAALMLHQNLDDAAWATAYGVYHVTYETKGYWFRTPEAWNTAGDFRAAMYMRPQSIWAMQWALDQRASR